MKNQINTYPSLTKSYKGFYPFKIGTTSFIFPDLYVPNVKMLGPFVDEIELLLFESAPVASLFSKPVIYDLKQLSQDLEVSYNIHLPTDISISDPSPAGRDQAVSSLMRVIERIAPLAPVSYTLHVPYPSDISNDDHLRNWQDVVYQNLAKIVGSGVRADKIAIETLDYPLETLAEIIFELQLSICLDAGHLLIHGYDIRRFFNKYGTKITIMHLHGVKNNHDHLSLDQLPADSMQSILQILQTFTASLSLEVFAFKHLESSLQFFEKCWCLMRQPLDSPC
ncbi:MAG: cobamide remodeling phosphodiesterase CbiR [Desulfobacterales bacterium]|jgi:sugar phosphate isomerase/epimerase